MTISDFGFTVFISTALEEKMGANKKKNHYFPVFANVMPISCFSIKYLILSKKYWSGFRDFILTETKTSLKEFYCWGNIHELSFHAIHALKFGSEEVP